MCFYLMGRPQTCLGPTFKSGFVTNPLTKADVRYNAVKHLTPISSTGSRVPGLPPGVWSQVYREIHIVRLLGDVHPSKRRAAPCSGQYLRRSQPEWHPGRLPVVTSPSIDRIPEQVPDDWRHPRRENRSPEHIRWICHSVGGGRGRLSRIGRNRPPCIHSAGKTLTCRDTCIP